MGAGRWLGAPDQVKRGPKRRPRRCPVSLFGGSRL